MSTPLQPRSFFSGFWEGPGEITPHPLLRWLVPRQPFFFASKADWLSDTVWRVSDRFEFASGEILSRKMYCELLAPDRVHATADDLPLGADILLSETGFRFTPYWVLGAYRGRTYKLRCIDVNTVDASGQVHDVIRMYWWGLPVAIMRIGPITRSGGRGRG